MVLLKRFTKGFGSIEQYESDIALLTRGHDSSDRRCVSLVNSQHESNHFATYFRFERFREIR